MRIVKKLSIYLVLIFFTSCAQEGVRFASLLAACSGLPLADSKTEFADGDGSMLDPFLICNVFQLQKMEEDLAAFYELGRNVDASDTLPANNVGTIFFPDGFDPVGDTATTEFTGDLEGNDFTISELYISLPSTDDVGLFGATIGSTIENLNLTDVDIEGDTNVGALIGIATDTILTAISVSGSVVGFEVVGGMVGFIDPSFVASCSSSAAVGGENTIGGLIGFGDTVTIMDSSATGPVTVNDINAGDGSGGGLIAVTIGASVISDSFATGDVTGSGDENALGGLISIAAGTITGSYATGNIISTAVAGFSGGFFAALGGGVQ